MLKSWAVPKGPSLDPAVRSLAVQVEDHPLEYGEFEGDTPEGEYGAGEVIVWDRGQWIPQGNPNEGLRRGKLAFSLEGEKLKGGFHLVRMKPRDDGEDKNWLLFKSNDAYAKKKAEFDVTVERPESVASGREIEDGATRKPDRRPKVRAPRKRSAPRETKLDPSILPHATAAKQPDWIAPELAKLVTEAPNGEAWVHEIKYDGYRILAVRDGARVRLLTRNKKDWTANFRRIAEEVAKLPVSRAILDGEVCVLDSEGRSDFQALQNAMQTDTTGRMFYFAFDLPFLDGFDLRDCPLTQRKEVLAAILPKDESASLLRFSEHIRGDGPRTLEHVCRLGLEGIISKRADSRYESRRSASWLKVKCSNEQEFVIGGYTDPQGGRKGFGALLLGAHDAKKGLVYCGRVGTGFDTRMLETMTAQLKPLEVKSPPFSNPPTGADARGVHWIKPTLVAQVKFQSMTADGIVRHAVFGGLRADKPPSEVVREAPAEPVEAQEKKKKENKKQDPGRIKQGKQSAAAVGGVTLSNPQRVLFPKSAITKADLAAYYEKVGDLMLPYIADRPLMVVRCPNGIEGACFHQKHPSGPIPATLRGVPIREEKQTETYLVVDKAPGLVALVQMNAVEIHTWGSRARNLEHPDRVVFDLDPGPEVAWSALVDAAKLVRSLLQELGLESYVKTSAEKDCTLSFP